MPCSTFVSASRYAASEASCRAATACGLVPAGRDEDPGALVEAAEGAVEGLLDDHRPGPGVAREGREPGPQPGHVLLGQPALRRQRRLGDAEDGRRGQPLLPQHRREVAADVCHRLGRHAVEDDRDGRAALGGLAQQVPRDGIGVAGCRGDEEPQVGGREELGGERAVGADHRVDVRGVEQRHARAGASATRPAAGDRPPSSPVAAPVTRLSPGSTRSSANQRSSSGWWTSTGVVVVGRSTPERLTSASTIELTRVDLPAPVEPPTTASRGASSDRSRGMT